MPVSESFLAFLDTETTGLVPGKDEVLEIATILTDLEVREISRFHAKILVQSPPPPDVAMINGYDAEVWAREARPFAEWKSWLHRHVPYGHVAIPVGHNVGFDRQIIDARYYAGQFFPLAYRMIDTQALAMALRVAGVLGPVSDVKLGTVTRALGIPHEGQHRAMGDCEAAKRIFCLVADKLGEAFARKGGGA